jgi:hypothetical protein
VGTIYGTAPAFTVTSTGLVSADRLTSANFSGTLSYTPAADVAKAVGSYTITPLGLTSTNYAITYQTGLWTVSAKALTITADNKSKTYLAPNPTFTATYAGFVNGEGPGALGGTLSYITIATDSSPVGTYTVTPKGLTSANYTIGFVPGTLSVLYGWNGFLQPINDTAHQIGLDESKFKLGQTIPAKFVLTDAFGNVVQQSGNPTFTRSGNRGSCDVTAVLDSVQLITADTVPEYKLTGGQYLYGWSTKNLTAGEYRIFANLADGTAQYVDICLTK